MELILTCSSCIYTGTSLRAQSFRSEKHAVGLFSLEIDFSASKSGSQVRSEADLHSLLSRVNTPSARNRSTKLKRNFCGYSKHCKNLQLITHIKPTHVLNTLLREFDVFLFSTGSEPRTPFQKYFLGSIAKPEIVLQCQRRLDFANWKMSMCRWLHSVQGLFFVRT